MAVVAVPGGQITAADVDASVARVHAHVGSVWDEWAWQVENKTWLIKGYDSWDEMRRAVYGNLHSITAPRAERPELVSRFRGAGLTQKETAETLGIGKATVERHDTIPGSRGPARNSSNEEFPEPDVIDAEVIEESKRKVRPRRPLPDALSSAGWDLRKAAEKMQRLTEDDRFPRHRDAVEVHLRAHLGYVEEVIADVLRELDAEDDAEVVEEGGGESIDPTPWRNGGGNPDAKQRENWRSSFKSLKSIIDIFADNLTGERRAEFAQYLTSVIDRTDSDDGREHDERPGATDWSRRVQRISASVPMDSLTVEQVEELKGAAEWLHNYTKGELITRRQKEEAK